MSAPYIIRDDILLEYNTLAKCVYNINIFFFFLKRRLHCIHTFTESLLIVTFRSYEDVSVRFAVLSVQRAI